MACLETRLGPSHRIGPLPTTFRYYNRDFDRFNIEMKGRRTARGTLAKSFAAGGHLAPKVDFAPLALPRSKAEKLANSRYSSKQRTALSQSARFCRPKRG
jgi:hypothetical protein